LPTSGTGHDRPANRQNKTVNITNYDNDADFAAMVGEATHGFDPAELARLKSIAESTTSAQQA
jgi:hypothetical protein